MNKLLELISDEDIQTRKTSLAVGLLVIASVVWGLPASIWLQIVLGILFESAWVGFWLFKRYRIPKNKSDKTGVLVLITTESEKAKTRLRNDLLAKMLEQISTQDKEHQLSLVVGSNAQAIRIGRILDDSRARKLSLIQKAADRSSAFQDEPPGPLEILRKSHCKFVVWGSIKEREKDKYFITTHFFATHSELSEKGLQEISDHAQSIWSSSFSFSEEAEVEGFNITADRIAIGAQFIIGAAAAYSGDVKTGLRMHKSVKERLNRFRLDGIDKQGFENRLNTLLADEYAYFAKESLDKKDIDEAKRLNSKCLELVPNSYSGLLVESIIQFIDGDVDGSLETVRQVEATYTGNNGTWQYNLAFLLMYRREFEAALLEYDKLVANSFIAEPLAVEQVIRFNEDQLRQNPSFIQSHFILGLVYYEKEGNAPLSLANFAKFAESAQTQQDFQPLLLRAEEYISRLKEEMRLVDPADRDSEEANE